MGSFAVTIELSVDDSEFTKSVCLGFFTLLCHIASVNNVNNDEL